jgi:hypothetical protein
VVTRRGFVAAGALAVLAGCGHQDDGEAPARPGDALLPSLAAERAFGAGVQSRRIAARSRERAEKIAAAISAEGGRPHDAPAPPGGAGDPVELGHAALVAHIAALPALEGRERRRMGAELVSGAAADVAVVGDDLGEHAVDSFPGSIP